VKDNVVEDDVVVMKDDVIGVDAEEEAEEDVEVVSLLVMDGVLIESGVMEELEID
jgi:hypothetical protein